MKKLKFTKLIVSLCLLTVSTAIEAQLLKGNIKADSIESMQIAYTPDGNLLNMMYLDIEPDENGNFSWDAELTDPTNDISIYVDNYIFGACVEKGKTINIRLEQNRKSKKFDVKFEGDNASVSNFYNAYTQAFDIMKYFSPDPEESKTTEEYREILEKEYATLKKKLSAIKKEKQYDYYAKLSEGMYTWTKLRIIMDQAENEDKSWKMYPEYLEIVKSIDPNDPDNIRTNLIYSWLGGQQKIDNDFNNDMTDYYLESIDIVKDQVENQKVLQALTFYIGYTFFTYSNGKNDVNKFWAKYKDFAAGYPDYIAAFETKVKSITGTKSGNDIPYNPVLTKADGTSCKLSDLFGSFLYIDIWATWCGPCCKEIPHMERVVEHYKGNDKVKFVSISVDQNHNAWLKKLEKDKPEWEQYIMAPEEEKLFMTSWGIGGIPRFIMLDKDGKIFLSDAPRPSNDNLIETIDTQL